MKPHTFKPLLILAAAASVALPLTAAPRESTSTRSSTSSSANSTSSDRRIDFGRPVRMVRNVFTRDDNSQADRSMSQPQRQKEEGQTHFWNRDQQSNQNERRDNDRSRLWNRDKTDDKDRTMKKDDEKAGFVNRLLNWRPFSRDQN